MAIPHADQVNSASPATPEQLQAGMRPIMTLIAATLQASGLECQCDTCLLLRSHAKDLVPLMARFIGDRAYVECRRP